LIQSYFVSDDICQFFCTGICPLTLYKKVAGFAGIIYPANPATYLITTA